jgi:hypothetical protein
MVEITKEDIREIIDNAIERHSLSDDHQFIKTLIAREKRNQELFEKIKAHVIGWSFLVTVSFLAAVLWDDVMRFLKKVV